MNNNLEQLLQGKSQKEALKILKEFGLISNNTKKGNLTAIDNEIVLQLKSQIKDLIKILNSHLKAYGLEANIYVKRKIK